MNERKSRERQQRREILLEAAVRVFGRKPFDEATMQEVAAEAQIGMQGLYEHFPSKQDLYEQVMLQRAQDFHERAGGIQAEGGSPLARLHALALAYAEHFKDQPMFLPLFIRDRVHFDWGFHGRFTGRTREIYEGERSRLKSLIEEAIEAGEVARMDTDFLSLLCLQVLEASLHHTHRHHPEEGVRACVDRAMDCFLSGCGGRR